MSVNANQRHPFAPGSDGTKCIEYRYPEYKRCDRDFGDQIHTGTRPAPPELEFPYPPCSLCGEDTYHDGDGFRCDPCGASWGDRGEGWWDEPDLPACPASYKPFDRPDLEEKYEGIRHHAFRCILPVAHVGKHRDRDSSEFEADQ